VKIDLKSPAVQKVVLSIIVGGGLTAVFFFTHLLPFTYPNQNAKIGALKSDYEKKATELARARATIADLPRFEAEYAQLHERWADAAELLPTDRQLPVLMRRISLAAQQNGVGFATFRPAGARNDQHFTETPIQISVFGNYHQVGSFLADLANMRRIVTVSNVEIKTNLNIKDVSATVVADFNASAYHLTTSRAAPAPPPAAATEDKGKEGQGHGTES
jgi:type IV pilus assembly protein PilO